MKDYFDLVNGPGFKPAPTFDFIEYDRHVNLCDPSYTVVEHFSNRDREGFIEQYRKWGAI